MWFLRSGQHHMTGSRTVTEVTSSESSRVHGLYTLVFWENRTSAIDGFPEQFAVVVVESHGENNII